MAIKRSTLRALPVKCLSKCSRENFVASTTVMQLNTGKTILINKSLVVNVVYNFNFKLNVKKLKWKETRVHNRRKNVCIMLNAGASVAGDLVLDVGEALMLIIIAFHYTGTLSNSCKFDKLIVHVVHSVFPISCRYDTNMLFYKSMCIMKICTLCPQTSSLSGHASMENKFHDLFTFITF